MRIALALSLLCASGCSIAFMKQPPERIGDAHPQCSDGVGAPIADGVLNIASGLLAVSAYQNWLEDDSGDDEEGTLAVSLTAATVAFAASTVIGVRWARACTADKEAWTRARESPLPGGGPPGSPGASPRGGIREPCYPNATCDAGLVCDPAAMTCDLSVPPAPAAPPAP